MPSHFSTIGLEVSGEEDMLALANAMASDAAQFRVPGGTYLRWLDPSGAGVWLRLDSAGDLIGLNPHFIGKSEVLARLESRVQSSPEHPLDGGFHAWADPPPDQLDAAGTYPFVFDCPEFLIHADLSLPAVRTVQVSAFAHEVEVHESEDAFYASQGETEPKFAAQSFIPTGLFDLEGDQPNPPQAYGLFTGRVLESKTLRNELGAREFHWALVETLGGTFDVVIDPTLVAAGPSEGSIVSGTFWFSGLMEHSPAPSSKGWFSRLFR